MMSDDESSQPDDRGKEMLGQVNQSSLQSMIPKLLVSMI